MTGVLDDSAFGQVLSWCGDPAVNAVLTAKESLARQNGIRSLAKADIREELPFEKADICVIFANALDNAAEGCMWAEESRREIRLEARTGKGVLAVSVKNACNDTDNAVFRSKPVGIRSPMGKRLGGEGQFPETIKKDVQNHGFGLRSIRETVAKYGGSMEINKEGQYFRSFLYLPLKTG